jgi:hypothetical protein
MSTQDKINQRLQEQLGAIMIELIIAKTGLEERDEKIAFLTKELEALKPKPRAKPKEEPVNNEVYSAAEEKK